VPSGTTSTLNGNYLLDSGVGFAVGDAGTILKTTDAGMSWLTLSSGTTRNLYDVYFFNDSEGVTVGDNGLILRTTDGGTNWETITSGVRDSLRAVSFSGANGICGGTSQDILYSTDSGASWHVSQKGFFGGGFFGAHMVSPTLGFVAGQNSIFQALLGTTIDGGMTWTFQPFYFDGNEGNSDDVFFFDASTGLTSGVLFDGRGALTRTTNGGAAWMTSLYPQALHGIDFPLPGSGFAVGGLGTILHSADMGQTWSPQESDTSFELIDVHFANNGLTGIAIGAAGTIVRTSNGGGGGDDFALIAAASRKASFEIELLDGSLGIECRTGGRKQQYTVVCTFDHIVTAVDGATTSCGEVTGIRISQTDVPRVVVNLAHLNCNAEIVTVTLNGVHDDQGGVIASTSVEMGLLVGDADGNGVVNETDVRLIKSERGQATDSLNFRADINANGQIEASDVNLATSALGTMLGP
ncbi:MAG: YCF48-related protein, partial [Verrucomicrobiota bacterium]|nr:YCF48-related protein [Verrucomicrobiota bacterium]